VVAELALFFESTVIETVLFSTGYSTGYSTGFTLGNLVMRFSYVSIFAEGSFS